MIETIHVFTGVVAVGIFIRLLMIPPSLSGRGHPGHEPPVPRGMPSDNENVTR